MAVPVGLYMISVRLNVAQDWNRTWELIVKVDDVQSNDVSCRIRPLRFTHRVCVPIQP